MIILVFAVVGFGVAQWDNSKVMFHFADDVKITIDSVDYNLQNASDLGLLGGLSCHTVSATNTTGIEVSVFCDSGVRTGGGCSIDAKAGQSIQEWRRWHKDMPIDTNGWLCVNEDGVSYNDYTAHVVCCE